MMNTMNKPPKWFWIVSVIALLWNLMGVLAYLMDAFMKEENMVSFSEAQKSIFMEQPAWVTGAYAIAVFAGAFGCIGLLIRKKWAISLFLISLIAVISRTIYYFFFTEATEVFDVVEGTVMPIVIIIIATFLLIFSRVSNDRNWIS